MLAGRFIGAYQQAASALGYAGVESERSYIGNAGQFLRNRGLNIDDYCYCLQDLVPEIIKRLPNEFPLVPFKNGNGVEVKWSKALFCCFDMQLHSVKQTVETELWMPTIGTLNEDLALTRKKKRGKEDLSSTQSIFQRHGYRSDLVITSHQLRHMLSTIAKVNGMSEQVLTKWAGRADPRQNRVYNHTTAEQYRDKHAMLKPSVSGHSELGLREFEIASPRTMQEINTHAAQTAHITEFGLCMHDYMMSPCSKHLDCINCEEQSCIKGEQEKLARLEKRLEREKVMLEGDKVAVDSELLGSDRHYQKRLVTIRRAEELIAILRNPDIPDGSVVKLAIETTTPLDHAMDKNGRKRLPKIEKFARPNAELFSGKSSSISHTLTRRRAIGKASDR